MGSGAHGNTNSRTVGQYLAARLKEVGVGKFFAVPGDFNMGLLDQLMMEPGLDMVGCCNELNAGYAADGYSRGAGIGCVVVTHMVGGLSVLNAIAGAYAEHHPVICIIGIPNTNDLDGPRLLHHTMANMNTADQVAAFREFTCVQERIKTVDRAAEQVDLAVSEALRRRRPVLIEILTALQVACNLAGLTHPSLAPSPVPGSLQPKTSNQQSLEAAVEAAAEVLNRAQRPAAIGGPMLKPYHGEDSFRRCVEAMGCPAAVQATAKGMFPETHSQYLGVYWGVVSSRRVASRLKHADALLVVGALVNDMNTVGFTGILNDEIAVFVNPSRVTLGSGVSFGCVMMPDFLEALPKALNRKWSADVQSVGPDGGSSSDSLAAQEGNTPMEPPSAQQQQEVVDSQPYFSFAPAEDPQAPLIATSLYYRIQELLSNKHCLVTDTGESLFQVMKLRLPDGCGIQMQAQYASIGWSIGAALGLAAAYKPSGRRVVAVIGDGAFQIGPQEIATVMRQRLNPIFIILNNGTYAVEEMIHPGEYNVLKVWDYVKLAEALSNDDGTTFAAKVETEEDLTRALKHANGPAADKFVLLDVKLAPNDVSAELLKFGKELGRFGSRPPRVN